VGGYGMRKYIEPNIHHVFRCGTKTDIIEGTVIPFTSETSAVYQIIADRAKRELAEIKKQRQVISA
jgi:hypothetical protein